MGRYSGLSHLEFLSFSGLKNAIVIKCQISYHNNF